MSKKHTHGEQCQHNHFDFSYISNETLKRIVTGTSVCVALVLIAGKFAAWYMTGSISILSSLADSVFDMAASVFSMLAVHHAMRPADQEHRFGHGKIEAIAALAQASIIVISVIFVCYQAVIHLFNPEPIEEPWIGVITMVASIVITLLLVSFQTYVIKKTKSVAISADSMHYKADMYLNMGVLASVSVSYWTGWHFVDSIVGFGIAIYILYASWGIATEAFDILMDKELSDEAREVIHKILTEHPEVLGYHELKTRTSGTKDFIQVHLEMKGTMTLYDAYKIVSDVEKKLHDVFHRAYITIHQEPQGIKGVHPSL